MMKLNSDLVVQMEQAIREILGDPGIMTHSKWNQ